MIQSGASAYFQIDNNRITFISLANILERIINRTAADIRSILLQRVMNNCVHFRTLCHMLRIASHTCTLISSGFSTLLIHAQICIGQICSKGENRLLESWDEHNELFVKKVLWKKKSSKFPLYFLSHFFFSKKLYVKKFLFKRHWKLHGIPQSKAKSQFEHYEQWLLFYFVMQKKKHKFQRMSTDFITFFRIYCGWVNTEYGFFSIP